MQMCARCLGAWMYWGSWPLFGAPLSKPVMTDWLIYLPSTLKVWEDCRQFSASRCRGLFPNTTTCCEELLRHMPRLLWILLVILCSQYTTTLTSSLPRNIFTALLFGLEEFLLWGERMTASCPASASPGHLQLVCGRVICSWSHKLRVMWGQH